MLDALINFTKNSWKTLLTTVSVITIVVTLVSFDSRYVKPKEFNDKNDKVAAQFNNIRERITANELGIELLKNEFLKKEYPADKRFQKKIELLEQDINDIRKKLAIKNDTIMYYKTIKPPTIEKEKEGL